MSRKDARGFWAVTRYQDVWAVGRDAKTYSSYAGGIMLDDPDEFSLQQSRSMMLHMDPPEHTRYRTLVSKEFIPRSAKPSDRASRSWRKRSSTRSSSAANAT